MNVVQLWKSLDRQQRNAVYLLGTLAVTTAVVVAVTSVIFLVRKNTMEQQHWSWAPSGVACTDYCKTQCKDGACISNRMEHILTRSEFRAANMAARNGKLRCKGQPYKCRNCAGPGKSKITNRCHFACTSSSLCTYVPNKNNQMLCACNCNQ
jgi:hypothetical protein